MSCYPATGGLEHNFTKIIEKCVFGMNTCIIPRLLKKESTDKYIDNCVQCLSSVNETISGKCPALFDYYTCWTSTKPGETAIRICPQHFNYFNYFTRPNKIYKTCLPNGTWSDFNQPGYFACLDRENYFAFQFFVRSLNITGLLISTLALLLSLLIFYYFRSLLKCRRTRIHVQLFISYVMSDIGHVIWEIYIMDVQNMFPALQQNSIWCQIFHVLLQFLITSNYLWMFCEGLNLFVSLVVVFIDAKYYMRLYYAIGWGFSFFIVAVYALARLSYSDNLSECWKNYSNFEKIIRIPITISLIVDCLFFVWIVKIICSKLGQNSDVKRAVKSALILVTLLGIQHIFFMHPDPEYPTNEEFPIGYYLHYLMQTITSSFQGFAVACIFCFGNQDVQCAVKSKINKIKSQTSFSVFGKRYFHALSQREKLVPKRTGIATFSHVTSSTVDV